MKKHFLQYGLFRIFDSRDKERGIVYNFTVESSRPRKIENQFKIFLMIYHKNINWFYRKKINWLYWFCEKIRLYMQAIGEDNKVEIALGTSQIWGLTRHMERSDYRYTTTEFSPLSEFRHYNCRLGTTFGTSWQSLYLWHNWQQPRMWSVSFRNKWWQRSLVPS
jgi:hypothetical protein